MAWMKRARGKRLVLDVGSSAVRMCELVQTKTGFLLSKYYQREFPIDPAMDEEEKRSIRRDVIKQLLKDSKSRAKKTIFGLPGQSIFNRARALPPVPEHKVTQIVRYEIQQQIPFPLDQIAFDYQVLQRTEAGGYEVLMAAIKVDVVEKHLALLKDIKRQVDIVDAGPMAAYNWLKHCGEFGNEGECVALIDIGASTTDIVIERGGQFRFARPLSIGGNDLTQAVAKAFSLGFLEAEKLKRERGFAPTGDARRDGKGGEIIGQSLSRLVSEITRTFAYYRSQPGGGPVSRVVLTGGGACLRNIVPYLHRELGLDVRIAQPLAGLTLGPEAQEVSEHPEQAPVALGLALRCCQSVPVELNLIPPRIIETARRREQALYWALSLATFGLILASIIPVSANKHKLVLQEIDNITRAIGRFDPALVQGGGDPTLRQSEFEKKLAEQKALVDQYKARLGRLDLLYLTRVDWLKYLTAIGDARPKGKGIWFSRIESCLISQGGAAAEGGGGGRGGADTGRAANTGRADGLTITGFSGVIPGNQSGGNLGAPPKRGGGPAAGAPQAAKQPKRPNGIIIQGFASEPAAIMDFIANLEATQLFTEGVHFDQRSANQASEYDLDNAPVGGIGRAPAAAGGLGGLGGMSAGNQGRDSRGLGGLGAGGGSRGRTPMAAGPAMPLATGSTLTTFIVEAQFGKTEVVAEPGGGAPRASGANAFQNAAARGAAQGPEGGAEAGAEEGAPKKEGAEEGGGGQRGLFGNRGNSAAAGGADE